MSNQFKNPLIFQSDLKFFKMQSNLYSETNLPVDIFNILYSKSPTYEPSTCKLSKMQTCVHMSHHVSQFTCLACTVMCMHPLQVAVLLCTLLYSTVQSTVVQYLYFKPRISGSKRKGSGDVAGTAKKRFTTQEMARGSYVRRHCQFLRHRTRKQNSTPKLQQPFRMHPVLPCHL